MSPFPLARTAKEGQSSHTAPVHLLLASTTHTHSTMSQPERPFPGLLDLPTELRLQIYDLVAPCDSLLLDHPSRRPRWRTRDELKAHNNIRNVFTLAHVNKKLRSEALSHFFRSRVVELDRLWCTDWLLDIIPREAIASITRLKINDFKIFVQQPPVIKKEKLQPMAGEALVGDLFIRLDVDPLLEIVNEAGRLRHVEIFCQVKSAGKFKGPYGREQPPRERVKDVLRFEGLESFALRRLEEPRWQRESWRSYNRTVMYISDPDEVLSRLEEEMRRFVLAKPEGGAAG